MKQLDLFIPEEDIVPIVEGEPESLVEEVLNEIP